MTPQNLILFLLALVSLPVDPPGARAADGQGFAAFGRVTTGMDVVCRIQAGATSDREQLLAPVTIARIYRK